MVGITGFVTSVVENFSNQLVHLSNSESTIFYLAIILIVSVTLAFIARSLKQPLIIAYVITGFIIGPLVLGLVKNVSLVYTLSEIGIAFLLFTAGLEISFRKIREANISKIIFVGILQVAVIFLITFFLKDFLTLTSSQAIYIGVILAFSSTMVDVKILSDRGELVTLHGRLVLGILLLQYIVAIGAIVFFTNGELLIQDLSNPLMKIGGLILGALMLQKFVLNRAFKFAAKSEELLFLSALATLFLFIIASYLLDISIVIGAFIAGVSLANSPFKIELEGRILPIRDFFAVLFFVSLGMQVAFDGFINRFSLFLFLILGALIIKPFVTFILLKLTGYQNRTSFMTSVSLAQLSEFSLKIGIIGFSFGILDASILSTVVFATIVTMSITPYLIEFKNGIFKSLRINSRHESDGYVSLRKEYLLIGAHRMGSIIIDKLKEQKKKLLVVDYNPDIISALNRKNISCIYGDIVSPEIMKLTNNDSLKTVISTIPNFEDNLYILRKIKERNPKVRVIVTGNRISESERLYEAGADYVITPKIIAGRELAEILSDDNKTLERARKEHKDYLKEIHRLLY